MGAAIVLTAITGCGGSSSAGDLSVGTVYPLSGPEVGGREQLDGVLLAADMTNASGGIGGRKVRVVAEDASSATGAVAAVDRLADQGIPVILGTYDTAQAIPASVEAARRAVAYVENGALADVVTHRGVVGILRTSVDGGMLGSEAATFVHDSIEPQAGLMPATTRVVVLSESDPYGVSVADGAVRQGAQLGMNVVAQLRYDVATVNYPALAAEVKAQQPDVIIAAPYVVDAVGFLEAAAAAGLHPRAIVGASSAYSGIDLARALGAGIVGLYAVDKPDAGINTKGLTPAARSLRLQVSEAFQTRFHEPVSSAALAAFVSAWVLFHEILTRASSLSQAGIWTAAMGVDLPVGSEVDGSGVKFAPVDAADAGQNTRAAATVSLWTAATARVTVYPASLAAPPVAH